MTQDTLKQYKSPHCDDRPKEAVIDLLVIHCISLPPGDFTSDCVKDYFLGCLEIVPYKASAHLFIRRSGEVLQFVPFAKRAWHAGESYFRGQTRCNDFSIGIELEGLPSLPFTGAQYAALTDVTYNLIKIYPHITKDRIVGHSDIAPTRKTDPGPLFDWARYLEAFSSR